ncbi:MAG: hypothetical protein A2Z73_06370 [Deltaproteobacteria bacterium RBG_13_60_28]|nr:MAG: hypothetical protein A2Z73_06370 [Deltaproteobacteria bacterium RBG_13_60_28]
MIKRLLDRFRRDRGLHRATVRIDFFPEGKVKPSIFWHRSQDQENDTVPLVVYLYARILFELAELNEVRVARELMGFVGQVCELVLADEGSTVRLRLPLGELTLTGESSTPPLRNYQAEIYQFQDGNFRLEFQGSLGKESFYLPGAFLVLLQSCLDNLGDEPLRHLARGLTRLHEYYRYRRDFWEGAALTAGPLFALSREELRPEAGPEA